MTTNWTLDMLLQHRDHDLRQPDGTVWRAKLYSDGWAIIRENREIAARLAWWDACGILNGHEVTA